VSLRDPQPLPPRDKATVTGHKVTCGCTGHNALTVTVTTVTVTPTDSGVDDTTSTVLVLVVLY
jgi:hypothetical protein